MLACELKFKEEAYEWEAKLREADRAWQERIGEMQQTWGEGGQTWGEGGADLGRAGVEELISPGSRSHAIPNKYASIIGTL